jgi:hypothetical protein
MSRKPLAIWAWACGSFGNLEQRMQLPLPCKKTSDVSQTSDVWEKIVGAVGQSPQQDFTYSTVTLLARLRGWSTLQPSSTAM